MAMQNYFFNKNVIIPFTKSQLKLEGILRSAKKAICLPL